MTVEFNRADIVRESLTALRFVLVGAVTLGIYVGSYTVFHLAMPAAAALTIAYVLAIAFHYLSSRSFTFRMQGQSRPNLPELMRYAALVGVGYLINLGCLYVATRLWGVADQIGLVLGTATNTVVTFLLGRLWVFKPQ